MRRHRKPGQQRGFSLIESMTAITLSGLLFASGVPLTSSWVSSARVRDAQGLMTQGVARARALALRNPGGVTGTATAAMLCLSGGNLRLIAASRSPQTAASCSATAALWSARLPASASVTAGGSALGCLAFNNRGVAVNPAAASGSDSCPTSTSVVIASSSQNVALTLY